MKNLKHILLLLLMVGSLSAADEIHIDYESSATLYAARFQPAGNVFVTNGSADEVWSTAADYDVTMIENGSGGHFVGSFDASANIGDGTYKVTVYEQLGGAPADSDRAIYVGEIVWKDFAEDPGSTESDNATTDAELAKVPKSDSNVTWNATALASIKSEAAAALTDYDGPTKTEMDTGHGLLATEAKQDIIDGVVDSILVLAQWMQDWMEADEFIDTTNPAQFQIVTTKKQSGGGGAELGRKDYKDIDGNPIINLRKVFAETQEP